MDEQHHHDQEPGFDPHSAASWDERYSGERVWSGNPNAALVAEVSELAPGTALEVGCGEGADAVWLAQHGWRVTALDISSRAVAHTLKAAHGLDVKGVVGGFSEAPLPGPFDLVSCMYPVLPKRDGDPFERLVSLVAEGGTLLFVHHDMDPAEQHERGFGPDDFLSVDEVATRLREMDEWRVTTDELRERHVEGGRGAGHTRDRVVRATRTRHHSD